MVYYNKVKGEIEDAISNLNIQNLNIFRPSLLLGKRNEQRLGEQAETILAKIINPFLVGKLKKHRAIQAEIIARAMVKISLDNLKAFQLLSPMLSGFLVRTSLKWQ